MLTVNIITVGKLKEKYLCDAIKEYSKRLSVMCKLNIVELSEQRLSDNPSEKEINSALSSEGKQILNLCEKNSYTFAMCIEGKQMKSTALATRLSDIAVSGKSTVNFIIGSSFGLSPEVKDKSDFLLSMSEMTFPHQLARVMLLEQIYRAFSIQNNSKYHK